MTELTATINDTSVPVRLELDNRDGNLDLYIDNDLILSITPQGMLVKYQLVTSNPVKRNKRGEIQTKSFTS